MVIAVGGGVGAGPSFEHGRKIDVAYRGQRRFPSALGAEAADPRVLVRQTRGFDTGGTNSFGQNQR